MANRPDKAPGLWRSVWGITLLALLLRLAALGNKSLWIDEAHSVYFARHSFSTIWNSLCDPHPPAYYALLRLFLQLGQDEFWVRLPSALAGTLTVPLLYSVGHEVGRLGRSLKLDRRAAWLAALLLAVAPWHVWYSQEARMYALVTLLGLGAVYFALRFGAREQARDGLGYVLVATAALYVDQSALLPLLVANLGWSAAWLSGHRQGSNLGWQQPALWASLQILAVAAFGWWWSQALYATRFGGGTLYQLVLVEQVTQRIGGPDWLLLLGAIFALAGGLGLGIGLWLAWRRWPRAVPTLLAWIVLAAFVITTVGSAVPRLYTIKRLLLGLLPYALLLVAWALRHLSLARWQVAALVLFSLALSLVNILWIPKEPWQEVVTVVQAEADVTDAVWVDELAVPAFDYYTHGAPRYSVWRATHFSAIVTTAPSETSSGQKPRRLWVVALDDSYRSLLDYLPASWQPVWSRDWHRIKVRAYEIPLPDDHLPDAEALPNWLLNWPSPLDAACR